MTLPWDSFEKNHVINLPKMQVVEKLEGLFLRGPGILDGPVLKGEYYDFPDRFVVYGGSGKFSLASLFQQEYGLNNKYPFWTLHGELTELGVGATEIRMSTSLGMMGKVCLWVIGGIALVLAFSAARGNFSWSGLLADVLCAFLPIYIFDSSRRQLVMRVERAMGLEEGSPSGF